MSYDLGRQKAAEIEADRAADKKWAENFIAERDAEARARMKEILTPEQYASYEKSMAEIDAKYQTKKSKGRDTG